MSKNFSEKREHFISRAKLLHGNKYSYDKVDYKSAINKVCISCPIHGDFWQSPHGHLKGNGCPRCHNKEYDTEKFISEAEIIHKGKYDYSKVEYVNIDSKVCIICPEHGEFWQTPYSHLKGQGCRQCVGTAPHTNETFINKALLIHKGKYDYSLVNYVNNHTKVSIICPLHGEFQQTPHIHLRGCGCYLCNGTPQKSREQFINEAKNIHGNKYDYRKVEYTSTHDKVCIICPIHGEFYQEAKSHILGAGCPHCKDSTLEKEVREALELNGISYQAQHKFSWLKWKKQMSVDFYLPSHNVVIECQGGQHFEPIDHFGGEPRFVLTKQQDRHKREECEKRGLTVIYYSHHSNGETPYDTINEIGQLILEINLHKKV